MADAREHGKAGLGNGETQVQVVEGVEVQGGSATPNHDHHVGLPSLRARQRIDQGRWGVFALHRGCKHLHVEAHAPFVAQEVHPKIPEARRPRRANQGHALDQAREGKAAIQFKGALGFQGRDGRLLPPFCLADHGRQVDLLDDEAHPVNRVVIHLATKHDFGAARQDLVCSFSQGFAHDGELAFPQGAAHHRQALSSVLFDQFQVHVARRACGQLGDFRLEPQVSALRDLLKRAFEALPKLGKRVDFFV